ncbi:MAG TPA: glycoside hydrolase family 3 C-terminal domain-containing protein, partial [Acidimicrobiales bacterium]|nr:glycoside hydrolase family 3 C-terminal domain-containing protein [Acidimicrobiales bacterium]
WGSLAEGHADRPAGAGRTEPLDPAAVEERARDLVDQMTLHEKLHLLSGDGPLVRGLAEMARRYNGTPYVAGALPRLGVPGVRFTDGPRGVVMGHATAFPVPMARGATFDPDLEQRVGDVIGVEARALGANLFAGVCVNLLRHPAWGRAQETYGEDGHLLGEMGAALVRGTQRHVMACVKHLACNSIEDARLRVDVAVDDDDLRDIYLPHFRRCVDEGVAAVMTAYNKVNGERCGHHEHLITEVLKGEWGFDGFVMSDFVFGVRSGRAVAAGQDLEMPFRWRFRSLDRLVRRGDVSAERVDDAALRIVRQQVRFADRTAEPDRPGRYAPAVVASAEHRALAREVAERSMVLLRNEQVVAAGVPASSTASAADERAPVLPLDPERVRSIAVLGTLAALPITGDHGSSHVRAPGVVSVLDGLRAAGERHVINVAHHLGDDVDAARLVAGAADVAVVVVGYTHRDEGEKVPGRGGDRRSLALHPEDEALIRTAAAANPRTVVVLVGGSAVVTESWRGQVGALIMAWYPGIEGGTALARLLFGEVEPGGRLPCTWPRSAEQLPPFDPDVRRVRYGPLHGYRLMEATGRSPAYPFGFGLTYTTFEHGRATGVRGRDGGVRVTVPVVNTGVRSGDEVVQLYVDEALGSEPRPLRTLRAFRRVTVPPGEMRNVTVDVPPEALARSPRTADGRVRLHLGTDADPAGHRTVEA